MASISGRGLRSRVFTPKFNGNHEEDHPVQVVFLAPSRGAMSNLQRLRLEGMGALKGLSALPEVAKANAEGAPNSEAAAELLDSAAPLRAWQAKMDAAQASFGREHIVEVRGLTLDDDDRAWMAAAAAPVDPCACATSAGTLAEQVEFMRLLPALWGEVGDAIHDAGVLGRAQGKG